MTSSRAGIQPKGATNNGNLFIPSKNTMTTYDPVKYGTDMRAIERWCNSLVAGGVAEVVLFQASYTTTGCGPGLHPAFTSHTVVGKLAFGGTSFPVTFTPTPSGQVKIHLTFYMEYTDIDNTGPAGIILCCVDAATGLVQETPLEVVGSTLPLATGGGITHGHRVFYEAIVPGLTAGAPLSWEIGGLNRSNTYSPSSFGISDGSLISDPYGPIVVTVYAA